MQTRAALIAFVLTAIFFIAKAGTSDPGYKPEDFKSDYQIDLKQDGYLILDEKGDVYYVPFDKLEDWFLEMNL